MQLLGNDVKEATFQASEKRQNSKRKQQTTNFLKSAIFQAFAKHVSNHFTGVNTKQSVKLIYIFML